MKTFVYKVKIDWLPTQPILELDGEIEAANATEAETAICEFYDMEMSVTADDIEFVMLEEKIEI